MDEVTKANSNDEHDLFCWKCHQSFPSTVTASFHCNCKRSFHRRCLTFEESDATPTNWLCTVCSELQKAANSVNPNELRMLPIIMKRVLSNNTYKTLMNLEFGENEVNLTMIKDKIETYKSLVEFRVDIEWIKHNCWVKFNNEGNNEIVREASVLVSYVKHEIRTLQKCWECFENANNHPKNWFTMVCTKLHMIVWAQNIESNGGLKRVYWPAKMLSVDEKMVNVQFFGDHTCGTTNECYMYSDSNPTQGSSTFAYNAALNEAAAYIKNIRNHYGSFVMAPPKTLFNPAESNRHFNDMVPGFGKDLVIDISSSEESDTEDENDVEIVNMNTPLVADNNPNHSQNIPNSEHIDKDSNQNTLNESDEKTCQKRQSLKRPSSNETTDENHRLILLQPNNGTNSVENRVNSGSTSSDSYIVQMTPKQRRNSEKNASVTSAFKDNMHQCAGDYEKLLKKLKEKEDECESVKKRMMYFENFARDLLQKVEQSEKLHKDSETQTNTLTDLGNRNLSAIREEISMINEIIAIKDNQRNNIESELKKIIEEKDAVIDAKDSERKLADSKLMTSEKHNQDLLEQMGQLNETNKNLEQQMVQMIEEKNSIILSRDEDRKQATSAMKELSKVIEKKDTFIAAIDAKRKKYCAVCGKIQSLGIFLCNKQCQLRLWEKSRKSIFKTGNKTDK